MQITKWQTIHQVAFFPRFFPVNVYLIEEDDGLTLIDAGLSFSVKGILETAKSIGKPIIRIIITHAHVDHVGALDGLKEILDVPVYISKRDGRIMEHDLSLDASEPSTVIKGGVPKRMKTKPDFFLREGDQVGSLKVVMAPGHTPGLMALLDTRNQALIVGDAFQTKGGLAVAGHVRPTFPFPAWGTWSKELSLQSAKKLVELKPALLATGHGRMLENPVEAMEKAILEAEKKFS